MLVKLLTARAKRALQDSLTFALPKVKVKVNQGIVRGCIEKLPNGKPFQRFLGIPYARPPINELRFRSPQKLLKFDQEEIDCTREGDASFHRSGFHQKYVGSEDCLNLNVYVPPTASPSNKLPVMLFIHGGGFAFDSNSRDFYSPEYLLMEDVVVVTINYRLQALGFLCLPNKGIPGNAALKDQQMALEWVYENISNFHGDPENICLFGESAAASGIHLHLMNSKSKKFIKSAIMQSNCALADWFMQKDGEEKSRKLAKLLGATGSSDDDCLDALMMASAREIYDNNGKVINPDEIRRNLPFVFKPVVEREDSEDPFMTEDPLTQLKTKQIDVPIILGMNDGDGMTMGNYYRNKKLHLFEEDNVRMVPLSLNIDPMSDEAKKLGKEIKEFYFGDKRIGPETLREFIDFMTDYHFSISYIMSGELHAIYHPNCSQYIFEFCFDGKLNMFKRLLKMEEFKGACHFDELFYLFDSKFVGMKVPRNSIEWKMRETMCKMWTNFAKYGNPTPDHNNPLPIKWNSTAHITHHTGKIDLDYLRIDKFPQHEIDCTKDRDACFHRSIFQQEYVGSEDCLYLNVYVPPSANENRKLPVMIYIHGGGFNLDSSSIEWYSPENLLMEDVIVVTLNYRLHVLGFLSLPSMGIPGNAGLKDQQMAIEWVHENINNFNGDANNICLFGESAGGASVHMQVLNPKSRSLIKSAICQSGCALGDWALQRDAVGLSRRLAKFLGCESDDDNEIYQTLMKASASDLFRLRTKPQDRDEARRNLNFAFKPCIEPESEDAFMSKHPLELIKVQENQINIPIMFGTTDKDGLVMVAYYKYMTQLFNRDYVKLVPRSLNINPNSLSAVQLGEEIKRFYFKDAAICDETIPQFIDHMTDFHFLTPQTIANEAHARFQRNGKQFLYEFQFDGELNHYKKLLQMDDIPGAGHADEICYLFNQRSFQTKIDLNSRTGRMRKNLCKLWSNFAKYGDPTPDHDNPLPIKWDHVKPLIKDELKVDLDYLMINDEFKMVKNINNHRMEFWRRIYEKFNTSFIVSKL
ncbi:CLUMA_CG009235, isoform A [Clunio marinus]|uniref:carboxylesterase n=1 Tax=Clunio marinus TaxID=568069 RepID=A0A1J1I7R5_9DIPT|nr:CLUMA_CG009235, isoform A [Clunio marinus]